MDKDYTPEFKALVAEHSENMLIVAYSLLGDSDRANEIIQTLLARLSKEVNFSEIGMPVHQFLHSETKKACEIS